MTIEVQHLMNGDLEISASPKTRKAIKKLKNLQSRDSEIEFIKKFLEPMGLG